MTQHICYNLSIENKRKESVRSRIMDTEKQVKKPDLKKLGKKAAHTAAGAGLAISLFFGSLFASPAEIVKPEDAAPPPAVVQMAEPQKEPELSLFEESFEEKRSLRDRMREWLTGLPLAVRIVFILPLWGIGFGIIWLISFLVGLMGIPVLGPIIKFLIGAAIVLGLILLAEKLLFPEIPLKKLLSKHNLRALILVACIIGAAGALGGFFWKDKLYITAIIDIAAAAAYVVFLLIFTRPPEIRRKEA